MNILGEAFAVVGLAGLLGSLFFFVPLWGPQLVFRKLTPDRPQRNESGLPPFFITDGFVLTAFVALANSLVAALRNEMTHNSFVWLSVCANLLVVLLWIRCLRFMSKHRIVQQGSRLLMQTLLFPVSVIVIAEMLITFVMLLSMLEVFEDGFVTGLRQYMQHPLTIAAASVFVCSVIAMLIVRYLFKRFIVPG